MNQKRIKIMRYKNMIKEKRVIWLSVICLVKHLMFLRRSKMVYTDSRGSWKLAAKATGNFLAGGTRERQKILLYMIC